MHRFFVNEIHGTIASLDAEDEKHAIKVLRLGEGDEVLLCDGAGRQCRAVFAHADRGRVELCCGAWSKLDTEAATRITLYQSLPKAGKLEGVLQKGTELGIAAFGLFASARCDVRDAKPKLERLARVIREAARQAGRAVVPALFALEGKNGKLGGTNALCELLKRHDAVFLAYEGEADRSLRAAVEALSGMEGALDVALIVGPEGGFDTTEVETLQSAGATAVSLGPRILRTETAGPAMAAMLLFARGDMDAHGGEVDE